MKSFFLILFFLSQTVGAQSGQKAILLDQFWNNFDNSSNFSFSVVDRYRRDLPDGDPIKIYLQDQKNFKAAQAFVKNDFITYIDTRFERKEIIFLNTVFKSATFAKFNELFFEYGSPRNLKRISPS